MVSNYPFDPRVPARRVVVVGKTEKGRLKAKLVQLRELADRKRFRGDAEGSPSQSFNWEHYGLVMAERRKREATQE